MYTNSKIKTAANYPDDALLTTPGVDVINSLDVHTLDELFRERVRRSSNSTAYKQFDSTENKWVSISWAELAIEVERWQLAFSEQGLVKGDRVAICYRNSIEWVVFDQAALRLGLVVVPLYTSDRADNMAFVIAHSGAKLALFANIDVWSSIQQSPDFSPCVETILLINGDGPNGAKNIKDWLPEYGAHLERGISQSDDLASIVYTSGTTGRPKGVMLSHKNMLSNAYSGMRSVALTPNDRLLSFLPLSHTLERTVGYYSAMMAGAQVSFNRSVSDMASDLKVIKPTVLISVPRIFERLNNQIYSTVQKDKPIAQYVFKYAIRAGWAKFKYRQGMTAWQPWLLLSSILDRAVGKKIRERLGGEIKFVIVGGAPLSSDVSKTFISLGVPLLQGYGMTESSPVVSVNTLEACRPESIGLPLRGIKVKLDDNDELWVQGDNVMLGYWRNDEATSSTIVNDKSGRWLRSGDRAAIDEQGFIRIIGRIKDILILANGEKVPPSDIEAAIMRNALFEQIMVVGEARPFLTVLLVLDNAQLKELCDSQGWSKMALNNPKLVNHVAGLVNAQMSQFPGYARVRKVHICAEPWTVESGLITPTLKLKRAKILSQYQDAIDAMYKGHTVSSLSNQPSEPKTKTS